MIIVAVAVVVVVVVLVPLILQPIWLYHVTDTYDHTETHNRHQSY